MNALNTYFKKVVSYFLQGLLLIAPVFVTVYSIWAVFNIFDTRANDLFELLFHFRFPGLGLFVLFAIITLIGLIGSTVLLQPIMHGLELLLEKTPLVKDIYSSIKDFISAFLSNKKKFNKPVLVTINKENNLHRVGFITQTDLTELGLPEMVVVYFPQSYAFAGDHFVVPKENIKPLNVSGPVAMKFIVSGGISGFKEQ